MYRNAVAVAEAAHAGLGPRVAAAGAPTLLDEPASDRSTRPRWYVPGHTRGACAPKPRLPPCPVSRRSPHPLARRCATGSSADVVTASSTARSIARCSFVGSATKRPDATSSAGAPKARRTERSGAAPDLYSSSSKPNSAVKGRLRRFAGQPWPEACLRPWLTQHAARCGVSPEGPQRSEEPQSGLTRRDVRRPGGTSDPHCRRAPRRAGPARVPAPRKPPIHKASTRLCGTCGQPRTAGDRFPQGAFIDSTERALCADLAVYAAWCAQSGRAALPAGADTVAVFVDAMTNMRAPATVRRYVASIAIASRTHGRINTARATPVQLALKRMHRQRPSTG